MIPTDAPLTPLGPYRREARALLRLGLPLIGSHVAQTLIVTTDTLMMGWYDVTALAALSLSGPLWFLFFILGSGFALAVMPMVATAEGQGDETQARRVTRMGMWLSVLFGVIVTPLFFFFNDIYLAIGQEAEVARLGGIYMSYLGIAIIPALLVMVLKSYLSALELTRSILFVTIAGAVLNAGINYLLIFGNLGAPEMGIAGAGLASILGNLFAFLALAFYAVKKRPDHELFKNMHRPDWEAFGRVLRLGLPIGFTVFAEVALFAIATVMMGWVGTIPLAAHGVALQISSVTFMVHLGLSQAATVRIGRAVGQTDSASQIVLAGKVAMAMSMVMGVVTIAAFLMIPEVLVGLFIDPADPDRPLILIAGASLLAVAALFQFADSAQVMGLGLLRGIQDTRMPMIIATFSYWLIGLPVSYGLGFSFGLGGVGIWLGLTAGLASAAILLQRRFWTGPAVDATLQ